MIHNRLKKWAAAALSAVMLVCFMPAVFASSHMAYLGDADESGSINAEDARLALRFAVSLATPTRNERKLCDVDGDGEVTSADARTILRTAVELDNLYGKLVSISDEDDEPIDQPKEEDPPYIPPSPPYYAGEWDVENLAIVVCQEAGGQTMELKMMVANVVMNRVASRSFPNTIYGVLTQPWQYERVTREGGIYWPDWPGTAEKESCREAARRVISGERLLPSNVVYQASFTQGSGVYAYYPSQWGGYYFCYE